MMAQILPPLILLALLGWLTTFRSLRRFWGSRGFRVRRVRLVCGIVGASSAAALAVLSFREAVRGGMYLLAFTIGLTTFLFIVWFGVAPSEP